MDRAMDRHRSNNTRTVLPRHPPGETGESTAGSSLPHQTLLLEASIVTPRFWWRVRPLRMGARFRVGGWFNSGLAPLHTGGPLHDTVSRRILGMEILRTLSQRLPLRISHGEWCLDSFTPMQLDVFHALWELYPHSCPWPRPTTQPSPGERLAANREQALLEVPIGTVVWRDFTDPQGRIQRCRTEVYDYKTPYWRVRHAVGDWEELTRTEIERGKYTSPMST